MPRVVDAVQIEEGAEMRKLRALVASYTRGARAVATQSAYASDMRDFSRWCRGRGRKALPATEETVCLYLVAELERWKVATVERRRRARLCVRRICGRCARSCGACGRGRPCAIARC